MELFSSLVECPAFHVHRCVICTHAHVSCSLLPAALALPIFEKRLTNDLRFIDDVRRFRLLSLGVLPWLQLGVLLFVCNVDGQLLRLQV